jgi:hypothetical protein
MGDNRRAHLQRRRAVWRLSLVPPEATSSLLEDARSGHAEAQRLVTIMNALADKLFAIDAPTEGGAACLTCDAQFWRGHYPRLVSVLSAEHPTPDAALVYGVCHTCCLAQCDRRRVPHTFRTRPAATASVPRTRSCIAT